MKQRMYIRAASAISPQHTFEPEKFLSPLMTSENGKLQVIDPDYRPYINPVAIRRMSRLMKMAISAAMQSLKDAGVETPDAIITGTGRGSMTDMELFLKDMIRLDEGALNPTIFIQSTYNAPNGWIALQSKSTAYNQTYVHRGCSLELALLDAQLIFAETEDPKNVLAGSYDELTDEYVIIKDKLGYWKAPAPPSPELHKHNDTTGTIGGEGAAFFTLSNEAGNAAAAIEDLYLLQDASGAAIAAEVANMLDRNGLSGTDIGLLLTGMNGDSRHDPLYTPTLNLFPQMPVALFKHLSGEYDTATGFGLWLADWIFRQKEVPGILLKNPGPAPVPHHLLLINHYITGSAVIMLLSRVK